MQRRRALAACPRGRVWLRRLADRGLFGNDNNGSSIYYTTTKLPSFFDYRKQADGTYPVNPFYPSNPYATIDLFKNREVVFRSITTGLSSSVAASRSPWSRVTTSAALS